MRSVFTSAPFSRFDLGRHALGGGLGLPKLSLGAVEDYVEKIEGLTDAKTKDSLRDMYKSCQEKEGAAQLACFAVLGSEVYQAIQDEPKTTKPAATMPLKPVSPTSEFPVIPVLVAVLGAGALIYFLAVKGKK